MRCPAVFSRCQTCGVSCQGLPDIQVNPDIRCVKSRTGSSRRGLRANYGKLLLLDHDSRLANLSLHQDDRPDVLPGCEKAVRRRCVAEPWDAILRWPSRDRGASNACVDCVGDEPGETVGPRGRYCEARLPLKKGPPCRARRSRRERRPMNPWGRTHPAISRRPYWPTCFKQC